MFATFAFCCITAPCSGVIIGGTVTHKMGGYSSDRALFVVIFMGTMTSVVGMPIPFVTQYWAVTPLLWLLLFFGGFMMPALIGMTIHHAPKNMKAVANSFAFFCYNLFGYLPAPFLYGFMQNLSG